jgi:hypothetical protein
MDAGIRRRYLKPSLRKKRGALIFGVFLLAGVRAADRCTGRMRADGTFFEKNPKFSNFFGISVSLIRLYI